MAELINTIEPTEKSYDIRLSQSEIAALLFLSDFTDDQAAISYKSYSGARAYTVFKPQFKELVDRMCKTLVQCGAYTHAQDYME